MAEYQLYCFAQSGNAYRAALMLNLIGADWQPVFVDFFKAGVQRTAEYRSDVNEMGEVPVLIHGNEGFGQSGVILLYLAEHSGKCLLHGEDERLEALRWILFDNQKVGGYLGPYRFLYFITKPRGDQAVLEFLKGKSTIRLEFSTNAYRAGPISLARSRPSPTCPLLEPISKFPAAVDPL